MKNKKIGVVGQGFVGSAVTAGLSPFYHVETFDIDRSTEPTCSSLETMISKVDEIVFVCLPTPMKKNGRCDTSIVETAISDIDDASKRAGKRTIAIIKSTIEPGTTERLNDRYENIDIVFNPEFLTEANSFEDFKNQNRIILGGPRPATDKVKTMFRKAFPKIPIVKTGSTTAETVKYFINCFLSTKVSFANEMKQLCDNIDVDFDKVVEYALYDNRIGKSHLSVPGPDGSLGFGGHCFPKDLNAVIHMCGENGVVPAVLKAVWDKNMEVRPEAERDWEHMIGRAISNED